MGSEVAQASKSQVPALRDPRIITAEDIAIPRLYIGQAISKPVEEGLVKSGNIFTAQDDSDPDPQVLAEGGEADTDGVVIHVLDLRKGISRSIDGVLETWAYNDPNAPVPCKETGAWTVYTYFVAIPEYADDIPFRWLLSRSAQPAAQKINTVLMRNKGGTPPYEYAFRVTTTKRSNKKGQQYFVPRVAQIEPASASVQVAADLYSLVEANQARVSAAHSADNNDPSI